MIHTRRPSSPNPEFDEALRTLHELLVRIDAQNQEKAVTRARKRTALRRIALGVAIGIIVGAIGIATLLRDSHPLLASAAAAAGTAVFVLSSLIGLVESHARRHPPSGSTTPQQ